MKLALSKNYEDLKFALTLLDPELEIISCDEGITLDNLEDFDEIAITLLKKYQPSKTLKELKRIRSSLEIQPIDKSLLTFISFYNNFKAFLNTANLKQSKFLNEVSELFNINYLFFYVLNIQVGQVIEVEEVEGSDKLFKEKVDVGNKLQIVSGVRQLISKEDFVGHKFLFITNIKPSKVRGIPSSGMILCGKEDDKVIVLKVDDNVPVGTRLLLEKSNIVLEKSSVILEENNDCKAHDMSTIDLKKAFFRNVFDKLKINDGFIEFEGVKGVIGSECYKAEINKGTIS